MLMQRLTPLLNVADVERSLSFWRDALGFAVTDRFELDGVLRWAELRSGEVVVMINASDASLGRERSEDGGVVIYLRVGSVRDLHAELAAKGVELAEPEPQDYGLDQVFATDPDGYAVCFVSEPRR